MAIQRREHSRITPGGILDRLAFQFITFTRLNFVIVAHILFQILGEHGYIRVGALSVVLELDLGDVATR